MDNDKFLKKEEIIMEDYKFLLKVKKENVEWLKEQKKDSGLSFTLLLNTLIDHARLKNLDWSDLVCEIRDCVRGK